MQTIHPLRHVSPSVRETADDIYHGQVVTSWARWFTIAAAAMLVLWSATTSEGLARDILPVIGLIAVNFFMHGRSLMERPANQTLVIAASALDLSAIALIVGVWRDRGLDSPYHVLFYPAVFAFALVMTPRLTAIYTGTAMLLYTGACLAADGDIVTHAADAKTLVMRLLTLAASAGLGAYYYRAQRERRGRTVAEPRGEPTIAPRPATAADAAAS